VIIKNPDESLSFWYLVPSGKYQGRKKTSYVVVNEDRDIQKLSSFLFEIDQARKKPGQNKCGNESSDLISYFGKGGPECPSFNKKGFLSWLGGGLRSIGNFISNGVSSLARTVWSGISSLASSVGGFFGNVFSSGGGYDNGMHSYNTPPGVVITNTGSNWAGYSGYNNSSFNNMADVGLGYGGFNGTVYSNSQQIFDFQLAN